MTDFGTLTNVDEIRKHWQNEASNFTPWLAEHANLGLLADAIGIPLELERTEVAVGPYSADILARDPEDNFVVIENQLGRTDHDHLGKLLTYAAVLDAKVVIWIAPNFTDEHAATVSWLNDLTREGLDLYAVRLELWRIDDSRPAVRFDVISRPAGAAISAAIAAASGELSETKRVQLQFWTGYAEKLKTEKYAVVPLPKPKYSIRLGTLRSGITLSNHLNVYEGRVGVRVYIRSKIASAAIAQLEEQKASIETEIGEPLEWDPNPSSRDKVIRIEHTIDISKPDKWQASYDWLLVMTKQFRAAFEPRVRDLDLDATDDAADEQED